MMHEELRANRGQDHFQNKDLQSAFGGKPEIQKFFQTQKISFDNKQQNIDLSLYNSKD